MKRKKLVVILTAAVVLLAFAVIAAARAELCPQCGGRITTTKTGYYGNKYVKDVPCSMIYSEFDEQWVKYRDTIYKCSTEGCSESYTETEKVYYTVCTHVAP